MIEDQARTADFDRRWVRDEPYVDGTPTDGGPFLVRCDGCEATLGPFSTELMVIIQGTLARWTMRQPLKKFSGIAHSDYCPECVRKQKETK